MKIIGIVGGVGPYAGLDFNKKIFDVTPSQSDQDHIEVILISAPSKIEDRTKYLLNPKEVVNPGEAIFEVITRLHRTGAELVAIPCNTAHAPPIMNVVMDRISEANINVRVIHMLQETFSHLKQKYENISRIGLLATKGTYQSKVYNDFAADFGVDLIVPDPMIMDEVHTAIYDPDFGIKSQSNPVTVRATETLKSSAEVLMGQGAQAIIMGCTEIPLAMDGIEFPIPLLDPMNITAQTLVNLAKSS